MTLRMDSLSEKSIAVGSRSLKVPKCKANGLGIRPIQSDNTTILETTASSVPEGPTFSALERSENPSREAKAEEKDRVKEKRHARRTLRPYFITDWCIERQQSSPSSNSASSDMLAILDRRIRAHHMDVHDMKSGDSGHGAQRSKNSDSAQDVERPHHALEPPTFSANVTPASEYYDPVHGLKWDERDFAWQWNPDINKDPRSKPANETNQVASPAQDNSLVVQNALSATKLTLPTRKVTSLRQTVSLSSQPAVRSYHVAMFDMMQANKRSISSNQNVLDLQSLDGDIEMRAEDMQLIELLESKDNSKIAARFKKMDATSHSIGNGLAVQSGDGNQPSNINETPTDPSADSLDDAVSVSESATSTAEHPSLFPPSIQVSEESGEVSNTTKSTTSGFSPRSRGSSPMELSINGKRSPIVAETYPIILECPSIMTDTIRCSDQHSTKINDTSLTGNEDSDVTATDSDDEISLIEPTPERPSTAEDTPARQVIASQLPTVHTPFIPWHPNSIGWPQAMVTPTPTPYTDRTAQQVQRKSATPTKSPKRSIDFWAKKGVKGIFSSPSLVPPDSHSPSKVDAQISENPLSHKHHAAHDDEMSMPDLTTVQKTNEDIARIGPKSTADDGPLVPEITAPSSSTAQRLAASGEPLSFETMPDPSPAEPSTSLSNRFDPSSGTSRPTEPVHEHELENTVEHDGPAIAVPSAAPFSSNPATPTPEPSSAISENTSAITSTPPPSTSSPVPPSTSPTHPQPNSQPKLKRKYKPRTTPNPRSLANTSPAVTRRASLSAKVEGEADSMAKAKGKSTARPKRVSKRVRRESSEAEAETEMAKERGKNGKVEGKSVKKVKRRSSRLSEAGGKKE